MSGFENFLCFSSAMARCGGTGSAEAKASQSKNKENFQIRSCHTIIHERDKKRIWMYHLRRKRSDFTFREQSYQWIPVLP